MGSSEAAAQESIDQVKQMIDEHREPSELMHCQVHGHYEGTCPNCGAEDLNFEAAEIGDYEVWYPYECNNCGYEGREIYSIEFYAHSDDEGNILPEE